MKKKTKPLNVRKVSAVVTTHSSNDNDKVVIKRQRYVFTPRQVPRYGVLGI